MNEKCILVPIDFTDVSNDTVRIADAWAQRTGAQLNYMYVYDQDVDHDKEYLNRYIQAQGVKSPFEVVVRFGVPRYMVLEEEKRLQPDLIIMAPHSHSVLGRMFLGSNTDYLVHNAKAPLFLHKRETKPLQNRIMVPVDFSGINRPVVQKADAWAKRTGAELHVVHVGSLPEFHHYNMEFNWEWDQQETESVIKATEAKLAEYIASLSLVSQIKSHLVFGKAYQKILEVQEEIRAKHIFMAAHNHTMMDRLMVGSTTDYLLHHTDCSMYIFREQSKG